MSKGLAEMIGKKGDKPLLSNEIKKRDWNAECSIHIGMNIPDVEPTIFLRNSWVCTNGGIMLLVGQKKAAKSVGLTMIMESALSDYSDHSKTLFFNANKQTKKIVYIDTEQHRSRTRKFIVKICKKLEIDKQPENLIFYNVARFTVNERKEFLKQVIYPMANEIGLLIIDGLIDFHKSMNDEVEAKEFYDEFFKSIPENVSVVPVMHSGKGSSDSQGHVGSLWEKRAAGVIHFSKDRKNGVFTITSRYIRDSEDFEDVNFRYDDSIKDFRVLNEGDLKNIAAKTQDDKIADFQDLVNRIFVGSETQTKQQIIEGIGNRDNTINKEVKADSLKKSIARRFKDLLEFEIIKLEGKDNYIKNFNQTNQNESNN